MKFEFTGWTNALTHTYMHEQPENHEQHENIVPPAVIFVNENKNENDEKRENNEFINEN